MDTTDGLSAGRGGGHRRRHLGAGRQRDARPHPQRHRRADRRARPGRREKTYTIHRDAPPFDEQATSAEILVTGIKVVDLLAPT
jgi:hypothetical protein